MPTKPLRAYNYEFSKVSYPLIILCGGVGIAFTIYTLFYPHQILGWAGMIGALGIALNFYSIKVSIDSETLLILYGIGFFAREFDLHSIVGLEMVENISFHSIYEPSRGRAPHVLFRSGGGVVLPIGDSRKLAQALKLPHA